MAINGGGGIIYLSQDPTTEGLIPNEVNSTRTEFAWDTANLNLYYWHRVTDAWILADITNTNYANDNLTADDNRTHDWSTFNQIENYTTGTATRSYNNGGSALTITEFGGAFGSSITSGTNVTGISHNALVSQLNATDGTNATQVVSEADTISLNFNTNSTLRIDGNDGISGYYVGSNGTGVAPTYQKPPSAYDQNNAGNDIPAVLVDPVLANVLPLTTQFVSGDVVFQEYDNGTILSTFDGTNWSNRTLDTTFANTNLTADANRTHNWDGNTFFLTNAESIRFNAQFSAASFFQAIATDRVEFQSPGYVSLQSAGEIRVSTPAVGLATATAGQVLTLVNATTGEAEYADASSGQSAFFDTGTTTPTDDTLTNAFRTGHTAFGADVPTPLANAVASFTDLVQIGDANVLGSGNPLLNLNRVLVDTVNAHGVVDGSDLTFTNQAAYNSYDARVNVIGAIDMDHYVSFQSAPSYNFTGTLDIHYGLFDLPSISSGVMSTRHGVHIAPPNVTGTGEIVNNNALYVARQNGNITGVSNGLMIQSNINTTPSSSNGILIESQALNSTALNIQNVTDAVNNTAIYAGGKSIFHTNLSGGNDIDNIEVTRLGAGLGDFHGLLFKGSSTYEFGRIGFTFDDTPAGGAFSVKTILGNTTETEQFRVGANGTIFNYAYGQGNKEATDLAKTDSGLVAGFATDGTIIEVTPAASGPFFDTGTTSFTSDNTTNAFRTGHTSFGADTIAPAAGTAITITGLMDLTGELQLSATFATDGSTVANGTVFKGTDGALYYKGDAGSVTQLAVS